MGHISDLFVEGLINFKTFTNSHQSKTIDDL